MAKNYMGEVAKMLGVELDEEFEIDCLPGSSYTFIEEGLVDVYGVIQPTMLWHLLRGVYTIQKEILKPKEKRYLEAILEPFQKRNIRIVKMYCCGDCYIRIVIDDDISVLPSFPQNKMYTGMEVGKKYTLEELGLFK